MTSTTVLLLLERLLWPVPRIRWEAARRVARLVRAGEAGVAEALLTWMARRSLESEALLGLGVIHAFELAPYFDSEDVDASVQKRSLLSEWMLRANHGRRGHVFRALVSPRTPLNEEDAEEFERYKDTAVAPIFLEQLRTLERDVGFEFVARWQHDWTWLRQTVGREIPEPDFFVGSDRGYGAQLHLRTTEILVTAYLRTLAYAMYVGKLDAERAEEYSMQALPLNRGLADLEPIARPRWSHRLLHRWRECGSQVVAQLWMDAVQDCDATDTLAGLTVVEVNETDFIEIEVDMVAGREDVSLGGLGVEPLLLRGPPARMAGDIFLDEYLGRALVTPTKLCTPVFPPVLGRLDAEVALHVRLACLGLGLVRGRVGCQDDCVELSVGGDVVSRWRYWYADWQPARPLALQSTVCGATTVARRWLQTVDGAGLSVRPFARVRVGTREHAYTEHDVRVEEFWIEPADL